MDTLPFLHSHSLVNLCMRCFATADPLATSLPTRPRWPLIAPLHAHGGCPIHAHGGLLLLRLMVVCPHRDGGWLLEGEGHAAIRTRGKCIPDANTYTQTYRK